MGDSTIGYPAPPGYDAEISANPQTLGTPRPLIDTGAAPGGDAPPSVTGGLMDPRPAKKELRMNRRVLVTQGTAANDDLAFVARSVIVDNDTGQWLFEAASRRYVPPGCFGAVLQFPSGSQVLAVQWTAPPGVTQPAGISGSQALLIYTEEFLDPSPGVIVPGTAAAGGVSGPVVVQGTVTPADATPNPTNAQANESFNMVWNGATWDRWAEMSVTAGVALTGIGSAAAMLQHSGTTATAWRSAATSTAVAAGRGMVATGVASTQSLNAVTATGAGASVDLGVAVANPVMEVLASSVTTGGTIVLQGSLEGTNWYTIGTGTISANGTTVVVSTGNIPIPARFLRANLTARTDGTYTAWVAGA